MPNTLNGSDRAAECLYPLAKIIENTGKAVQPGVLLLDASAKPNREKEELNKRDGRVSYKVSPKEDTD